LFIKIFKMKKLLLLLFAFVAISINAQVETIPTVTGSNSGDGEIKAIVAVAQSNDGSLQDSVDANAVLITANTASIVINAADIDSLENPPHASMTFQDSAFVIDLTQSAFSKITNLNNDLFTVNDADDMTVAGDTLTIVKPGNYLIIASLSFSGTNADVFEFAAFKNAVIASVKMERSTSATDIGNISLPFYLEGLVAGDDISLKVTNTASNDDATVVACSWITQRLHE